MLFMLLENTTWSKVVDDCGKILAPIEWVSRKLFYLYSKYMFLHLFLAIAGGMAILVAVLDIADRKQDRLIRDINLFVQIKGEAHGEAVASALLNLIHQGMNPATIPLSKVNLQEANLSGINLRNAYIRDSELKGIDLSNSNLDGVVFDKSFLNEANLSGSTLVRSKFFDSKTAYIKLSQTDLTKAQLDIAFMFGADLSNAKLVNASLFGTIFANATLVNIDATDADMTRANFKDANLTNAILINSNLSGADFTNATLDNANVSGAKFEAYDDDGNIFLDEKGFPYTAQITSEQLSKVCALPTNPPKLPRDNEYAKVQIKSCSQP